MVSPALVVPLVLKAPAVLLVPEDTPVRRAALVAPEMQAVPAKLVLRAQSVLLVFLVQSASPEKLVPSAPSGDPVSAELLALAVLPGRWDILVKPDLLGRLVGLVPKAHAVFPVLLDQLVLKAYKDLLARAETPSRLLSLVNSMAS